MTPTQFCQKWCEPLTDAQTTMLQSCVERGIFAGAARPLGRMVWFPAVLIGARVNVIDGAGHYQLGSPDGFIAFKSNGKNPTSTE